MNASKKPSVWEKAAEEVIRQLKEGTAPWVKPWEPGQLSRAINAKTGNPYRGYNAIRLGLGHYRDPRYLTFRQAKELGGTVKKGEHGIQLVFWSDKTLSKVKDGKGRPVMEDGKPVYEEVRRQRGFMRTFVVFNASQTEGLDIPSTDKFLEGLTKERTWDTEERAEKILVASGARIEHDQADRAFYRPSSDSIHLPDRGQFGSAVAYYETALHELGHWTGHESRLDRDLKGGFGSSSYAREELRAEMASFLLAQDLGLGHDPSNHASYVGSWVKILEDAPKEIYAACRDAEKIRAFVMEFEKTAEVEAEKRQRSSAVGAAPAGRKGESENTLVSGDIVRVRKKHGAWPEVGTDMCGEQAHWLGNLPAGADERQEVDGRGRESKLMIVGSILDDAEHVAMLNQHFRTATMFSEDGAEVGDDGKYQSGASVVDASLVTEAGMKLVDDEKNPELGGESAYRVEILFEAADDGDSGASRALEELAAGIFTEQEYAISDLEAVEDEGRDTLRGKLASVERERRQSRDAEMTAAERLVKEHRMEDAYQWDTPAGEDWEDVLISEAVTEKDEPFGSNAARYEFADGSAIVKKGARWDFGVHNDLIGVAQDAISESESEEWAAYAIPSDCPELKGDPRYWQVAPVTPETEDARLAAAAEKFPPAAWTMRELQDYIVDGRDEDGLAKVEWGSRLLCNRMEFEIEALQRDKAAGDAMDAVRARNAESRPSTPGMSPVGYWELADNAYRMKCGDVVGLVWHDGGKTEFDERDAGDKFDHAEWYATAGDTVVSAETRAQAAGKAFTEHWQRRETGQVLLDDVTWHCGDRWREGEERVAVRAATAKEALQKYVGVAMCHPERYGTEIAVKAEVFDTADKKRNPSARAEMMIDFSRRKEDLYTSARAPFFEGERVGQKRQIVVRGDKVFVMNDMAEYTREHVLAPAAEASLARDARKRQMALGR